MHTNQWEYRKQLYHWYQCSQQENLWNKNGTALSSKRLKVIVIVWNHLLPHFWSHVFEWASHVMSCLGSTQAQYDQQINTGTDHLSPYKGPAPHPSKSTPVTIKFANGKSVLLNVFQHTTLIFFLYILPNGKIGVLLCRKYYFNHPQKLVPCNKEQTQHQVRDKYVNSNKNHNCSTKINVRRMELTFQWCRLAILTFIISNEAHSETCLTSEINCKAGRTQHHAWKVQCFY